MKDDKVLVAFVAGALIGAALGVLFAPHKGSKTRRIINEEGLSAINRFRERIEEEIEKFAGEATKAEAEENS